MATFLSFYSYYLPWRIIGRRIDRRKSGYGPVKIITLVTIMSIMPCMDRFIVTCRPMTTVGLILPQIVKKIFPMWKFLPHNLQHTSSRCKKAWVGINHIIMALHDIEISGLLAGEACQTRKLFQIFSAQK